MSRFIRTVAGVLFSGFILVIFAGVASEYFTELARDKGWYDNPSASWDAGIKAVSEFVTQTWFLCTACGLGGFTIGLWLDRLFRRRETMKTGQKPQTPADAHAAMHENLRQRSERRSASNRARREFAKALDDLHAEGANLRSGLLVTRDDKVEELLDGFGDWDRRVLAQLDNRYVSVMERSQFRTLDLPDLKTMARPTANPMWDVMKPMLDEKLDRLRAIINRVGR